MGKLKNCRRAVDAALDACGRVVSMEGLGACRAELQALQAELPAVAPVKAKQTLSGGGDGDSGGGGGAAAEAVQPPAAPTAPAAASETPPPVAPVNAPVRGKSVWNNKDTWEEVDMTDWAVGGSLGSNPTSGCFPRHGLNCWAAIPPPSRLSSPPPPPTHRPAPSRNQPRLPGGSNRGDRVPPHSERFRRARVCQAYALTRGGGPCSNRLLSREDTLPL